MLRFILRALGFVLVAAAFAALVVDGTRSIAGDHLLLYSLGDTAAWLAGARISALFPGMAAWPEPARAAALGLLAVPGWIVTGGLGLLLLYAGRPAPVGVGFSGRGT